MRVYRQVSTLLLLLALVVPALADTIDINIDEYNPIDYTINVDNTVKMLRHSSSDDVFIFNIDSHGGKAEALFYIIEGIERTDSEVHMKVDGVAMSAAAILAFSGDSLHVSSGSTFMFHLARKPIEGGVEVLPLNHKTQVKVIELLDELVGKYLTRSEVRRILIGQDVFIDGSVIKSRLKTRDHLNSEVYNVLQEIKGRSNEQ